MGRDDVKLEVEYRSLGVLAPGESLEAFDIVDVELDARLPHYAEMEAQRQKMIPRIDEARIVADRWRGFSFIQKVDGGLRHYERFGDSKTPIASPLRWFIVPALMLLAGAIGSAFISFRWK